jgi:hypothetical protein
MTVRHWLAEEAKSIALTTAFFAAWFLALMTLKTLVLEEYEIRFSGVVTALFGALITAKVVIVLRHVPVLGPLERAPAWLWIASRTVLYTLGVLAAATLERAFETRGERGVMASLASLAGDPHWPHLLAATLGVGIALFVYNATEVLHRHMGGDMMRRAFGSPLPPPGAPVDGAER